MASGVHSRIDSGRYENAQDLLRAALCALQREEMNSPAQCPAGSIAESDTFRKLWEASDPFRQLQR
jgi:Arc/MetJ-type ribon-helix-helix transcriptional regulator